MYTAPYAMVHLSKKELNLTHFYTIPDFLLTLWKDLAELTLEKLEVLKKKLLMKLCAKEIFCSLGPNISLPDIMGRCK